MKRHWYAMIVLFALHCTKFTDEQLPQSSISVRSSMYGFASDSSIVRTILEMNGLHPALFDTVARQWEYGRLKELNLRGLGITTLPSEICSLSYLANLDISYNNLQSLPAEIVQLCLISTYTTCDSGCTFNCCRTVVTNGLSIRNNGLCTVPKAIGDWIDLHFGGKNYLARDSTQRCGSQ